MNNDDFQTLETEMTEVKKSVSDGKTLVAAAVTRKDVQTAATDSFATIASNIDSITTVEQATADATAIAADILINKTAYANAQKLIGTMANNGAVSTAIAAGVLKKGYTSGGAIANLTTRNVRKGVNIGGVVGNLKETKFTTMNYKTIGEASWVTLNYPSSYQNIGVPVMIFAVDASTTTGVYAWRASFWLNGSERYSYQTGIDTVTQTGFRFHGRWSGDTYTIYIIW